MNIDLHIHTTASDGATPPRDAMDEAAARGLGVISLTDHESIEGYLEIRGEAADRGIKVLAGVELLTTYRSREIHLLGYLFDPDCRLMRDRLHELREQRNQVASQIVDNLRQHGFNIDYDHVAGIANNNVAIGKNHILHAIYEAGYISTQDEMVQVLRKYLTRNTETYVEFTKNPLGEAVELIRECRGIPVLAHPGIIRDEQLVQDIIRRFGLPGIEVYYYYFGNRDEMIERYETLAREWGLLATGGSDYHGRFAPVTMGDLTIPPVIVERLEEYHRSLNV
ncbi:MAG: PHP domain-containing protein [Firmicutes bacterium]|nr:PHP domain-containing protein [Bacillota bacterium]